jgi:hypothetical protein
MAGGKPIPKSKFALPSEGPGGQDAYPVDTVKRARNALSRIAQNGTPAQKAKVRRAVQRRYSGQVSVGGVQNHANALDFADGNAMACPQCGYSGSASDFKNDGDYDNDSARKDGSGVQPEVLRTRPGNTGQVRDGVPLTVRGSGKSLANAGGRAITLAQRLPVRENNDILVSRAPDGTAVVRHRRGGNEVGQMKRTADGWTPVVNGKNLSPHRQQRGALMEMFGTYNREVAAQPLLAPPVQTPLMQTYGVPAIRLASDNDDTDSDDSASPDTSSDSNGLTPRGQGIYKKLVSKGVKPAVAMAMAKRAQNTKPGSFGNAKAS